MERSGAEASPPVPLDDLAELTRREGPFVTVWAGRPPLSEPWSRGRLSALRREVGGLLPESVVDAVADAVDASFPRSAGVVVVGDRDGVVFREVLSDEPRHELVRLHSLPSLAAVIEHRQASVPFVLVVADRRGADLVWSHDGTEGATSVPAADGPETKVAVGGWSQRRFQQRAENTWQHTAADIADVLQELVGSIQPRVIAVAGDVRVGQMLRDRLPAAVAERVREVPGGRSADGSADLRDDAVQRWVRTAVAEDTVAVLQTLQEERGQNDRAADGPTATFAALREGRVDTLVVTDSPDDIRPAWFAPEHPAAVADQYLTITDLGYTTPRDGRLIDVAIRAALLTNAGVRVVPARPLNGGMAAILRW